MKTLRFLTLGSLVVIVINVVLAVNASMNGTYDASQVKRIVPFIFIFIFAAVAWLLAFAYKKLSKKSAESDKV